MILNSWATVLLEGRQEPQEFSLFMSDLTKVKGWIEETDREREDYGSRVSAAIKGMKDEVQANRAAVQEEDGTDSDLDKETWNGMIKSLEDVSEEYCSNVDESVRRAKQIVDVLVAWPPPEIQDIPQGSLDGAHRTRVEQWVEDIEKEKIEYVSQLSTGMKDVREDIEGSVTGRKEGESLEGAEHDQECVEKIGIVEGIRESYCSRVKRQWFVPSDWLSTLPCCNSWTRLQKSCNAQSRKR